MRRLKNIRRQMDEDVELDMVPIMNMFLVLIPFLLMSASFLQMKAINTSVPVLSSGENTQELNTKDSKIKLTIIVELKENNIHVSATSDNAPEEILNKIDKKIGKKNSGSYPVDELGNFLKDIKVNYPESDTVIIIPEESIVYETIIKTMDIARYSGENPMFPKVVLSGKIG